MSLPAEGDCQAAVTKVLRGYADRGVFRGFAVRPPVRGRIEYRFLWLVETPFHLVLETRTRTLTFRGLLPNVPYPSAMDRSFRAFLAERSSLAVPEHRRIDPTRAAMRCSNRASNVSVAIVARRGQCEYAAQKAVALVNEIFHGFLRGPYSSYMIDNFGEAEE